MLFTISFYCFLFSRNFGLTERKFFLHILVPFPDSNNSYSCEFFATAICSVHACHHTNVVLEKVPKCKYFVNWKTDHNENLIIMKTYKIC